MLVTADQLAAHLVGDYLLQPHWMATEKTRRWAVALAHGLTYALPFLLLRPTLAAWTAVALSHAVVDRWRLARYLTWAKNLAAPRRERWAWRQCQATGFPPDVPPWLAGWLLIVTDNTVHVLLNAVALRWL